MGTSARYELCM